MGEILRFWCLFPHAHLEDEVLLDRRGNVKTYLYFLQEEEAKGEQKQLDKGQLRDRPNVKLIGGRTTTDDNVTASRTTRRRECAYHTWRRMEGCGA